MHRGVDRCISSKHVFVHLWKNNELGNALYLLSELQTSGKNGQFRTPRHIIRLMIALLNPDYSESVADPAAGSAGFLINTIEHVLKCYTPLNLSSNPFSPMHSLVNLPQHRAESIQKWEKTAKIERDNFC